MTIYLPCSWLLPVWSRAVPWVHFYPTSTKNDLHEIFNGDCDPGEMGSAHTNSISWAYGLMLRLTSNSGLQRCLENLKTYCQKCGLVVNTENTKTMVLSKKKYIPETFTFGDIPLQAFKSINYIGFVISYNGKYRNITTNRIMKCTRMSNMVLQTIWTNRNVSVRFALSLFDKQITPILYGCPIWSLPDSPNLIHFGEATRVHKYEKPCIWNYSDKFRRNTSFANARPEDRKIPNTNRCILIRFNDYPDSKVHGAIEGPIWGWQDPGGPHVGPMNLAIWVMVTK